MKWGKRNGPPYPLNAKGKASLAKQKKASNRVSSGDTEGISELAAFAAVLGLQTLFVASPVLISAGKKKIHEMKINGKLDKTLKKVEKNKTGEIDEKTGFHKKTKEMSVEEDAKAVNPGHNREIEKTNSNCVYCSMTYEMRRRGFDVTAELRDKAMNGKKATVEAFPGAKPVPIDYNHIYKKPPYNSEYQAQFKLDDKSTMTKLKQMDVLAKQGLNYDISKAFNKTMKSDYKGTRGSIMVQWPSGYGGHALSYDVDKKGNVSIIDPQVGTVITGKTVDDYLARTRTIDVIRLDNVKYDPEKVKEAMK